MRIENCKEAHPTREIENPKRWAIFHLSLQEYNEVNEEILGITGSVGYHDEGTDIHRRLLKGFQQPVRGKLNLSNSQVLFIAEYFGEELERLCPTTIYVKELDI